MLNGKLILELGAATDHKMIGFEPQPGEAEVREKKCLKQRWIGWGVWGV